MRNNLLLFLMIPSIVLSQGISNGAANLKIPITPFVASTGESFVADPTLVHSLIINPANIAQLSNYNIIFSHTEWIQDTRAEFFSVAAPFQIGSFALSISNTSVDEIEIRDTPGPAIGTFNYQSTSFEITYGVSISENIQIGIAPKYHYEKIFSDEATGFGFSAGALYNPNIDNLVIGASITDIGKLSAFRNDKVDLPSMFRLGGTYTLNYDLIDLRTAIAYGNELRTSVKHLNFGVEANYNGLISILVGYQTGYEIRGFSAGIGFQYDIANVDYAFIPFSQQAGSAHIISIRFSL
jgi:hypothetical protein